MAGAIGLKFDPATALQYRQNKEAGNIQHEIELIKLQLQLDQLKRDAELVRNQFDSQTTPVNEDIGTLVDATPLDGPDVTVSAVDQLSESINKLNQDLTSRLDSGDTKLPLGSGVDSSPFDDFRDRSSYRDMLKAALNAARLDQLHDYANARLIRLNFQASVVPDEDYSQSIGAIQVDVVNPSIDSKDTQQFLQHWLEYINTYSDYRNESDKLKLNEKNDIIRALLISGSFEKVKIDGIELLLPIYSEEETNLPSKIYERSNWRTSEDSKNTDDIKDLFKDIKSSCEDDLAQNGLVKTVKKFIQNSDNNKLKTIFNEIYSRGLSIVYIRLAQKVSRKFSEKDKTTPLLLSVEQISKKLNKAIDFQTKLITDVTQL